MNSAEEAEDILQESFISAFKNISNYRGDSTFGSWLKRIVINNSINVLRKNKLEFAEEEEKLPDIVDDSDEQISDLTIDQIRSAIEVLPDGFRAVLSLYLLEGYDHKEIGEILGISESTSKSQFNRSKRKLREILKEKYHYER